MRTHIHNVKTPLIHILTQLSSCWIRGPMRLAIYDGTGQDKRKNQRMANTNYEQNLMSINEITEKQNKAIYLVLH